jgi:hypothetical protein
MDEVPLSDRFPAFLGPGDAMMWDGEATGEYEVLEPLEK